ncbi:hypothetical protein C8R47DRAFT_69088 [Mycena vitilis]|nr:hypothetical protein C8R47DRAFT_69088 [Mycena vitilis]
MRPVGRLRDAAFCIRTPRLARRSTTISPPFAPPASRSPYSLSAGSWSATSKTTHRRSSSARWATEARSAAQSPSFGATFATLSAGASVVQRRLPRSSPPNHEKVLEEAFFREVYVVREYVVPAALRVNTDQTQLVHQQGAGSTWTQRGAKQVATVGQEEKRAFTLVPSISASGVLLPMQAVFQGKTAMSCPSPKASRYDEAIALGYVMLPSKTSTYWSNHDTMHWLVNDIIAPYFDARKKELGLKPSQMSIWKIDCWSVHKSKSDKAPQEIRLDTTVGTLRDRSVGWIVQAIQDLSDPETVTHAFEMCRVGDWNLSQASLTSPEALAGLRALRTSNPALHASLTQTAETDGFTMVDDFDLADGGDAGSDDPYANVDVYDDCDIPLDIVAAHLSSRGSSVAANFVVDADGGIARSGDAEASDGEVEAEAVPLGRGQRKKTVSRRFQGPAWEEH